MTSSQKAQSISPQMCPGCGAQLRFNPKVGQLSCSYCQTTVSVSGATAPLEEQDFSAWVAKPQPTHQTLVPQTLEVSCPSCTAQVTFRPPQVAGNCPFCNTHITAQPRTANPGITPGGVMPFQVDDAQARRQLAQWLKKQWLAPHTLKHLAQHEGMQGVYLPFWTFDCSTQTRFNGERGTEHQVTKTRQVQTEQGDWIEETYEDSETHWTPVSGTVQCQFDDLLVPAITSVSQNFLKQLAPWNLVDLKAYDERFLRGFQVQRHQVDLRQGFEQAKLLMKAQIQQAIEQEIGGDFQRIHSQSTTYQEQSFKQILLPVWMATYRFKNSPYQVVINGVTGKVVGDAPVSLFKIVGIAGAALFAMAIFLGVRSCFKAPSPSPTPPQPIPAQPVMPPSSSSASTPQSATLPTRTPSNSAAKLKEAFTLAGRAAQLTQTAQTRMEWLEVSSLWVQSIELLKQVRPTDPDYVLAQQKIQEYQRNLNYARKHTEK